MNRPYVICHILSSLDSKINGAFMAEETTRELAKEYGNFRAEMNADAWLYGTTTKEFTDFRRPVKELDGRAAMEKLYELFHIEKLLICGGGVVNYTFLQAGMVDELSLFMSPMTDGGSGNASLFSRFSDAQKAETVEFELKDVKRIGRGGVHLQYLAKNTKIDSDDGKSL